MSNAQQFIDNDFKPIKVNGELVFPFFQIDVSKGDKIIVSWVENNSPRSQGIALRLRNQNIKGHKDYAGTLAVNNVSSSAVELWRDQSPSQIEIAVEDLKEDGVLIISNIWKTNGRKDEWLNNYGILVDQEASNRYILSCSDGVGGEPDFTNLVVRIKIEQ